LWERVGMGVMDCTRAALYPLVYNNMG